MYPAEPKTRSKDFSAKQIALKSPDPLLARAGAHHNIFPVRKFTLTDLRDAFGSYARPTIAGVGVALLAIAILLGATNASLHPFEGLVAWMESPILWIALIAIQLCFAAVFLTERRRTRIAEQQVSEDDLALAAASANIGLWSWDIGSDKIRASDLVRQILGMKPGAQCTLRQFFDCVHSEDQEGLRTAIDEALATGHKFDVEVRVVLRERGIRWINAGGRARSDKNQRVIGLTGVFLDITDRKHAETEAAQQREYVTHLMRVRTIGALSGAVAHELNQPLTAILSNAQAAQRMLSRQSIDIRELRTTIKDIIDDDSRAAQVIKHLRLLLAKSEANFETVGLSELVGGTLDLVRAELIERQIRLNVKLDPALPAIKADQVQLQQVILNLILNAADALMANPSKSRALTLSAARDEDSIEFVCSDNGPGIPTDSLGRLFEPFYTTKKHGLGLGLLISRSIVTMHGGSLWATNNPDRGAAFHLKLPISKAAHG